MSTAVILAIITIIAIIGSIVYRAVEHGKELKHKRMQDKITEAKYKEIIESEKEKEK